MVLSDFVVSTDSPSIADAARAFGAKVPFLRPAPLASDEISVWPTVLHAVTHWENECGGPVETVVLLQPTSPLRSGEDVDACVARFREAKADFCATAVVAHDNPYFNMVEKSSESSPFFHPCIPFMRDHFRRQTAPPVYSLNGAVYVVRRDVLTNLDNPFRLERYAISEMPRSRSVDVDVLEDLEMGEFWLARNQRA